MVRPCYRQPGRDLSQSPRYVARPGGGEPDGRGRARPAQPVSWHDVSGRGARLARSQQASSRGATPRASIGGRSSVGPARPGSPPARSVWSMPRIRSVGAQAAAGSPPPSNTTPTVLSSNPIPPGGGGATGPIVQGVQEEPPASALALTGAELGNLAALGGTAVGLGELIRRKGQSRKRALEAEAELYGPPAPSEPTDIA